MQKTNLCCFNKSLYLFLLTYTTYKLVSIETHILINNNVTNFCINYNFLSDYNTLYLNI